MGKSSVYRVVVVTIAGVVGFGCGSAASPGEGGTPRADSAGSSDAGTPSAIPGDGSGAGEDANAGDGGPQSPDSTDELPAGLPTIHVADPDRAQAGLAYLQSGFFGPGLAPRLALRWVWLAWPGSVLSKVSYIQDDTAFWAAFRARYGLEQAPWDNGGLPLGLRDGSGGYVAVDCLACHAGRVPGGDVRIGAPSGRVDLEALHDDLVALPAAVEALKASPLPEPWASLVKSVEIPAEVPSIAAVDATTGAAGASDGFGLGVALGFELLGAPPELNRTFGYQDPPPWWTHQYKTRMYTDGSVAVGAHRTMMATLLVSGMAWSEIAALDPTFTDVAHALMALQPPRWTDVRPESIDPAGTREGRALFRGHCAGCHGQYEGVDAEYPNAIIAAGEVGTDATRASHLGRAEADAINALMMAPDYPMTPTGGYLAPPLVGIWASAPYLHNGSVPDLAALLAPGERPTYWRRVGSAPADFDPFRVGWRYEVMDGPGDRATPEGRRIYDTTYPGLSNAGHEYGTDLTAGERAALVEYLKSL